MEASDALFKAVDLARKTMNANLGGPFGAALVDPEGNLYIASNSVLGSHDPTAHAEVNVIRQACEDKQTHDLSGCILYTTCYPCPMCLSAAIWANIKEVFYGCTAKDAEAIGFRDDFIYNFINSGCTDEKVLRLQPSDRQLCMTLFDEYASGQKTLY